jgi:hypothetical protein
MPKRKKRGPETGKKCDQEECACYHEGHCAYGIIDLSMEDVEPDDSMHCPE